MATWKEVLTPAGWTAAGSGEWRRPGKTDDGISATTGGPNDTLYVFSTSAHPLEAGTAYSKFAAYAILHRGGDFAAAAKAAREAGYREDAPAAIAADLDVTPAQLAAVTVRPTAPEARTDRMERMGLADVAAEIEANDPAPQRPAAGEPAMVDMSDVGNAILFCDLFGRDLRWVREWKKWLRWNGVYWQPVAAETIIAHYAQPMVRSHLLDKAKAITDDDRRKRWLAPVTGYAPSGGPLRRDVGRPPYTIPPCVT